MAGSGCSGILPKHALEAYMSKTYLGGSSVLRATPLRQLPMSDKRKAEILEALKKERRKDDEAAIGSPVSRKWPAYRNF